MPTTKKKLKRKPAKKRTAKKKVPALNDRLAKDDPSAFVEHDSTDDEDLDGVTFTLHPEYMQPDTVRAANLSGNRRDRRRRPRRRWARGMVRDYILDAREANPHGDPQEWLTEARDRIKEDFGDTPFLDFLLEILREYGPVIIELLIDIWLDG